MTGNRASVGARQPGLRIRRLSVWRGAHPGQDRIELAADNGMVGAGEGAWCEHTLSRAAEIVLGRSPFEAEAIYDELASAEGQTPGGLDIALWDLAGKSLGIPSALLLGKTYRSKALACASVRDSSRPEGFRMWRWAPRFVEEVRGGFDCGFRLTVANQAEALDLGACLDKPAAFWESPLIENDAEGYRGLREKLAIPIAASGGSGLDLLIRDLVQPRLVDIVIPEIGRIGLTGIRRLAYYCWLFRVRGAVECSGSAVSAAAALAAAACFVPTTNALAAPAPFVVMPAESDSAAWIDREGMLAVPCGPGLGVEAVQLARSPDIALGELP